MRRSRARRASYRDRALVVRTYDFGEADRVVVLLTREHGIVRACAQGVRRVRSRFGSRVQPFVELECTLYPARGLHRMVGADTVDFFATGIIDDFERYCAACAVLESAENLVFASLPDEHLYDLVTVALRDIANTALPTLRLDAFLLTAMRHAGWAPSLFDCAQCGAEGPHHHFDISAGGAVCSSCAPAGSRTIPSEILHWMWLLAHDHAEIVVSACGDESPKGSAARALLHDMTEHYLQWHMERAIRSLAVLDQGC